MKPDKIFDKKIGDKLYCIKNKEVKLISCDYTIKKGTYYKIAGIDNSSENTHILIKLFEKQMFWFSCNKDNTNSYIYEYFADRITERKIKLNDVNENR